MKRLIDRAGWVLAGALALALVGVAARAIQAGPLDPPGPVASTMKTLGDLPPSWHRTLSLGSGQCDSQRFPCVMSGGAVLDNETGLVWQATVSSALVNWSTAVSNCTNAESGAHLGWRLPTAAELGSILIPGVGATAAPVNLMAGPYWTSDRTATDATRMVTMDSSTGKVSSESLGASATTRAWCVRGAGGGTGIDAESPFPDAWSPSLLAANDGTSTTNSSRFRDYGNPLYVVDQETGLMWQVTPSATTSNWAAAMQACARFNGTSSVRLGWRLPTLAELLSLFTSSGSGVLPTGHPFTTVTGIYWTSTMDVSNADSAATVDVTFAELQTSGLLTATNGKHWCVRGGPGE